MGELFKYGPAGSVLIVATSRLAARITLEEGPGPLIVEGEALWIFVSSAKVVWRWESRELLRAAGRAGPHVVLHVLVPVRGEHERDVKAGRISLALLKAVTGWEVFRFGLDVRDGHRLAVGLHYHPQHIVHATAMRCSAGSSFINDDRGGSDFSPDEVFGPTAGVKSWIDELRSRVGFGEAAHSAEIVCE